MSPELICTAESWMRRAEPLEFVVKEATDILRPDLRNSGEFVDVPDKPALGIALDSDVVKAHVAEDETWRG